MLSDKEKRKNYDMFGSEKFINDIPRRIFSGDLILVICSRVGAVEQTIFLVKYLEEAGLASEALAVEPGMEICTVEEPHKKEEM